MVLLKRKLPDGDGYEVLRHLRRQGSRCGVVVLAGSPSIDDRIDAFELGADHYLAVPIRMRELLAVLNSLAWRTYASASWRVCPSTWNLFLPSSEAVKLTGQETLFLSYLASHPAQAQSRKKIVESLGKSLSQYDYRNLDALVLRLRKKVAQHTANPLPLKTVHGMGYSVSSDVALVDS
jgi:DNA-binding response OmpR family regulator